MEGVSLNILFARALGRMQISRSAIKPVTQAFHCIVPGSSTTPIDQISLPITFRKQDNFRIEKILFDVVNFETAYKAILGRHTLTKFMAAMHCAYQCVKILGPKGVITVRGCPKAGLCCDMVVRHHPSEEPKSSRIKVDKKP